MAAVTIAGGRISGARGAVGWTAAVTWGVLAVALTGMAAPADGLELPYREAGLTEREAAAHLLDRFAFGARPGEVDRVLEVGLATWIERQIAGTMPEIAGTMPEVAGTPSETTLSERLAPLDVLGMSIEELAETFPPPGLLLRQLRRQGKMSEEATGALRRPGGEQSQADRRAARRQLMELMKESGYRPQRELLGQTMAQKTLRAVYAENQLHEVLTDFWFNHFNVSITDNQVRPFVLAYERDAIRPHVAGSFRELLEATARHPAMLVYLDNASSRADEGRTTTIDHVRQQMRAGSGRVGRFGRRSRPETGARPRRADQNPNRPRGLNENYARELLELHTLGVDGGYTQDDVIEVARAFTGWTTVPPRQLRQEMGRRFPSPMMAERLGMVVDGGFLFNPGFHDAEKKVVLGRKLPAGRGIEDGEEVLDLVARHPSTARHLAHKLAVRFVSDQPPEELEQELAATFLESGGRIDAMLRTLVESPSFWASRGEKIKSPFELVVSAARALDAEVANPRDLVEAARSIGQPLYAYQAPTGYPDRADFWVNTGALLNRMNFGMAAASGRSRGVRIDLDALAGGLEPSSVSEALELYGRLLMPERDLGEVLPELEALARAPSVAERLDREARAFAGDTETAGTPESGFEAPRIQAALRSSTVAQVVGVLLGSPEFQRR